ncbi:hypothetical protein [Priestia abyssalis]|uniref:hypothetical protein n=1 Tax=Priestia abyssalis TaxID=1221450 RepID=UPI0009950259|nr:hypothetical protein [Priestia abyssalis]
MSNNQQRNKPAFRANAQKVNEKTPVSKPFETEFAIETDTQAGKPSQAQKEDQNSWYAGE